jgi:hypothetical protein
VWTSFHSISLQPTDDIVYTMFYYYYFFFRRHVHTNWRLGHDINKYRTVGGLNIRLVDGENFSDENFEIKIW